jgi:murein L,D-transpeptidase YafK
MRLKPHSTQRSRLWREPLKLKRAPILLSILCGAVAATLVGANFRLHSLSVDARADKIVVEKSARRLTLLRGAATLATYRVSLGRVPIGAKFQERDHRTPEGDYVIDGRNQESAFHRALHISYPNPTDTTQAARRRVSPGGEIMIHGIRNGLGWIGALHRLFDWTSGVHRGHRS